jgi:hypothetical protein
MSVLLWGLNPVATGRTLNFFDQRPEAESHLSTTASFEASIALHVAKEVPFLPVTESGSSTSTVWGSAQFMCAVVASSTAVDVKPVLASLRIDVLSAVDRITDRELSTYDIVVVAANEETFEDTVHSMERSKLSTKPMVLCWDGNRSSIPSSDTEQMRRFVAVIVLSDEQVVERIAMLAVAPRFVLWDAAGSKLSPKGELALRRAFWLLDKDCRGELTLTELQTMLNLAGAVATEEAADRLLSLYEVDSFSLPLFLQMAQEILSNDADSYGLVCLWALLRSFDTGLDGLPYSAHDIAIVQRAADDLTHCTYLSELAIQFFANLYLLNRFQNVNDMWLLTPNCPWEGTYGLPRDHIPLDRFIECLKWTALTQPTAIVRCARYWGYKGESLRLFRQRHCREFRTKDEALPNTLMVLMVGSPHCGLRSVMRYVCSDPLDPEEEIEPDTEATYVRTLTFHPAEESTATTIVFVRPSEADFGAILDGRRLRKYDAVVLAYDGSDPYSASYIAQRFKALVGQGSSSSPPPRRLPVMIVRTKADQDEAAWTKQSVQKWADEGNLVWPPVQISVAEGATSSTDVDSLHDLLFAIVRNPEMALARQPIPVSVLVKRTLIVCSVVSVGLWLSRKLLKRKSSSAR